MAGRDRFECFRRIAVRLALVLATWSLAVSATAQTLQTVTVTADASTLGMIPDGPTGGIAPCTSGPGSPRLVTFTVTEPGLVVGVTFSMTFAPMHARAGELQATLFAPDGTPHLLYGRPGARRLGCGSQADVAGPYTFSDEADSTFFEAAVASAASSIPSGTYRTSTQGLALSEGGVPTSLDGAFAGRLAQGQWRLIVEDFASGNIGGLSAASVTLSIAPATRATPTSLGELPPQTCTGAMPLRSLDVTFDVSGRGGLVAGVTAEMTLNVRAVAFLQAELIAPDGVGRHVLFPSFSSLMLLVSSRLAGTYQFSDRATGNWASAYSFNLNQIPDILPPGAYRAMGSNGAATAIDPPFTGRSPNGRWTLRLTSCSSLTGAATVSAAQLSLLTTVSSVTDAYAVEATNPLVVAAPGVLGNDAGAGRLTAALTRPPASGTLTLGTDGGLRYLPSPGFVGQDRFEYRATSAGSVGPATAVTIDVTPLLARPPAFVEVVNVVGNHATLRWDPPTVGATPAAFEMTAGTVPGQVLARVPLPPDPPVFEFDAPPGIFFLRLTTQATTGQSAPSADARLSVGVADPPSAPLSLTGLVNGDILTLHWKDTFAGGVPTHAVVDVSGAFTGSLPIGAGGAFTFRGVPPGTYTFAVRGSNSAGTSGRSNPVTLTFPAACSGPPAPPTRYLAFARGASLGLLWDPPTSGPAPERYDLHVSGSFTGTVPMGLQRVLLAAVPSGSYSIAVSASNACGTSPHTEPTIVTIR